MAIRKILTALGVAFVPFAAAAVDVELRATLDADSVVSATESTATGEAYARLGDDDRVRIDMVFGGLASGATGAGLFEGKATENGDLVAELDVGTDQVAARLDDIEIQLSPEVADQMRLGETYLQVETIEYPDGAIRGQLVPQPVRLDDAVEPEEED